MTGGPPEKLFAKKASLIDLSLVLGIPTLLNLFDGAWHPPTRICGVFTQNNNNYNNNGWGVCLAGSVSGGLGS